MKSRVVYFCDFCEAQATDICKMLKHEDNCPSRPTQNSCESCKHLSYEDCGDYVTTACGINFDYFINYRGKLVRNFTCPQWEEKQ